MWVLALQLLNMSICSEAYWFYYNGNTFSDISDKQADPTETIVEWLVEMKLGQQDVFTYNNNNIDSKNTVKAIAYQIDLENHITTAPLIFKQGSKILFAKYLSGVESAFLEILSPPPDSDC
ncbi:MAG TPA: hypothetical protein DIC22_08075 [Chitinophagaceae bacterium]|jgi:hypothetical protein|nr:hypothetical protein [Chitinophagaceae bacterium]